MNEYERRLLTALAEQQGHDDGTALLRNLSSEAAEGKLPPFVGRFAETTRLLETVNRHSKANALLVGPAGCGKTAIIENLARVIHQARSKLPKRFSKTRVFSLRTLDLIADTGIVGALEKRIKTIFEKILREGDIVFIDETHGLVGAGNAQGSQNDAANLLKPLMDRGGISVIGATTDAEYRHMEKDQALRRRFSLIRVQPMSKAETGDVVKKRVHKWSGVINDQVIASCLRISAALFRQRAFPDGPVELAEHALSICELNARNEIQQADLTIAGLHLNGLEESDIAKLDEIGTQMPKHTAAISQLHGLLRDGEGTWPVHFDCGTDAEASQLGERLAEVFGELLPLDLAGKSRRELLGADPGTVGFGDALPIYRAISNPLVPFLVRRPEKNGENETLFKEILHSGAILDSRSMKIPVSIVASYPEKNSLPIGFIQH